MMEYEQIQEEGELTYEERMEPSVKGTCFRLILLVMCLGRWLWGGGLWSSSRGTGIRVGTSGCLSEKPLD